MLTWADTRKWCMRFGFWFICIAVSPAPAMARERYAAELFARSGDRWTGVADLPSSDGPDYQGELCVVRAETPDSPAFPRTLLRIPVSGRRDDQSLKLEFEALPHGPVLENGAATLRLLSEASSNLVPAGSWQFGDFYPEPKLVRGDPTVRMIILTGDEGLVEQLTVISSGTLDQVGYYKSREDQTTANSAVFPLSVYDSLTRDKVRSFEKSRRLADLFTEGMVLAVMDTAKIRQVQEVLDQLGDGARVLNAELADCPAIVSTMIVSVPPGLELWYTRRLQVSGSVKAVYPEVNPLDPFASDPFLFTTPALTPVLRNSRISTGAKYQAIWTAFNASLSRFANALRSPFQGQVTILQGGAGPNFRAEIKGRGIIDCKSSRRWEKIVVDAHALAFDSSTGRVSLTVKFADGFFGLGNTMPPPARLEENRIGDSDLEKLQRTFVSATEAGASSRPIHCS